MRRERLEQKQDYTQLPAKMGFPLDQFRLNLEVNIKGYEGIAFCPKYARHGGYRLAKMAWKINNLIAGLRFNSSRIIHSVRSGEGLKTKNTSQATPILFIADSSHKGMDDYRVPLYKQELYQR